MNKAERRKRKIDNLSDGYKLLQEKTKGRLIAKESNTDACADCVADLEIWQEGDTKIFHMAIQHEDTCPALLKHIGE
jgi:hypothetical protein